MDMKDIIETIKPLIESKIEESRTDLARSRISLRLQADEALRAYINQGLMILSDDIDIEKIVSDPKEMSMICKKVWKEVESEAGFLIEYSSWKIGFDACMKTIPAIIRAGIAAQRQQMNMNGGNDRSHILRANRF